MALLVIGMGCVTLTACDNAGKATDQPATTSPAAATAASPAHTQLAADHQQMEATTAAWKKPTR